MRASGRVFVAALLLAGCTSTERLTPTDSSTPSHVDGGAGTGGAAETGGTGGGGGMGGAGGYYNPCQGAIHDPCFCGGLDAGSHLHYACAEERACQAIGGEYVQISGLFMQYACFVDGGYLLFGDGGVPVDGG
jgi:hypothetical protein